jgi:hypothetical protein
MLEQIVSVPNSVEGCHEDHDYHYKFTTNIQFTPIDNPH